MPIAAAVVADSGRGPAVLPCRAGLGQGVLERLTERIAPPGAAVDLLVGDADRGGGLGHGHPLAHRGQQHLRVTVVEGECGDPAPPGARDVGVKLTEVEDIPRNRAGRKRDQRAGITGGSDVRIVNVHTAHRPTRTAAEQDSAASTGRRAPEWSCRWPVGPYRRNTCLNPRAHSTNGCEHEDRIVPPHIKGPADKPLRIGQACTRRTTSPITAGHRPPRERACAKPISAARPGATLHA